LEIHKDSKFVVTGGSGLVGAALVAELQKLGFYNVVSLGSRDCDLRDGSAVDALFQKEKPDYVFHMAAKVFGLGGNARFKSDVLVDNVLINTNVIESSRKVNVKKIVAMGSGCVYPDFGDSRPVSEDQIWNGPPHPSEDSYGHSKRLMLAQLNAAKEQYGLNFAFAISGNLYGPADNFDTLNGHVTPSLVAKFFEAANAGTDVSVWGTGAAIRDFTYSDDMARALIEIFMNLEGPVNAGSGQRHAIREIVEILASHTGVKVSWDSTKPDGQLARFYDLSKLKNLGFSPLVDLQAGVTKTYDWYAANYPNVRK
jgi:GDP-L-fucose synthase